MLVPNWVFNDQRRHIAEFAIASRLPLICANHEYVEAGALISYGENIRDFVRRAAGFVDKIIKGAKPSDLPVEAADTILSDRQPQDCEGARPSHSAEPARACR